MDIWMKFLAVGLYIGSGRDDWLPAFDMSISNASRFEFSESLYTCNAEGIMLNQQSNNIRLLIKHEKQSYKLIELPPGLLNLLESTSSPNLSITPAPSATSGPAILKLGSKAYSMRSKSSSNTFLLLQPPDSDLNANKNSTVDTMIAVSQCDETIELVPISENPEEEVKKVNKWHDKFVKSR